MKSNTFCRFSAYLIDLMIIGLIFIIIYHFLPQSSEIQNLNHEITLQNEQLLNHTIRYSEYFHSFSKITYQLDRTNILYSGLNILLICFYFIIIPLLNKGKTLGLYILGLQIESEDNHLNMMQLFIRNLIVNGLFYLILSFIFIRFLQNETYFITITILGIIQILLVIISIFMILYRKDKRGLQDILSQTKITKEVLK